MVTTSVITTTKEEKVNIVNNRMDEEILLKDTKDIPKKKDIITLKEKEKDTIVTNKEEKD